MCSSDLYAFDEVTATDGFFNESEVDVMNSIVSGGSGVYKLTLTNDQFTSAEKVEEVAEPDATLEDGRITIVTETEKFLYVKFAV